MAPSAKALEGYLEKATRQLYLADPDSVTVNSARRRAEEDNDLEKGFFVTDDWKARSKTVITEFVQTLQAEDSPRSVRGAKAEKNSKHGVKRSSSDEVSGPSATKRRKKTASATAPKKSKSKPKKESSSSELSELSDSENLKMKEEETEDEKATGKKQESESELSDLESSEDEPKPKTKAKKKAATQKSKKEETESELSDLSSFEDEPKSKAKPAKKRGGKLKQSPASDDEVDASSPRLKRKKPIAKPKNPAKRTKAESDDENKSDVGDEAKKSKDVHALKKDEDVTAKDEDPEDVKKTGDKDSKPLADDSDSSLSSVIDDPPPKKRKGKEAKGAPKPKQSTAKEVTGDEAEIKKLQGQLLKCGVRKIWGIEMKKFGDDNKAKMRHLRDMLRDVGMDGRFSEAKAREIKERRELKGELDAVNEMNELWGLEGRGSRASRSKVVRKSLKEESDEDEDAAGEQKPNVEDGEDDKSQATSRVSKRMADLAFLGSESESE